MALRHYKTKVEKRGAFWQVQVHYNGAWYWHRDLHSTRQKARNAAKFLQLNGY